MMVANQVVPQEPLPDLLAMHVRLEAWQKKDGASEFQLLVRPSS
jgi:hypothetical protein